MKIRVPSTCATRCVLPWPLARAHAVSLSVAPLLAGLALPASAQDPAPALPEMVVTATRSPTRIDELVSDTVVIERAQIEQ